MKWSRLLTPLSPVYGAVVRTRAAAYRHGLLKSHDCGLPVVSVGNLTFGGTGKTPMVLALTQDLVKSGRRPAVLTRGYGRKGAEPLVLIGPEVQISAKQAGDEPLELAQRLPGVPIVVDADRLRGALRAAELGADIVILDDGFQHLRLRRDLDLLLLDAGDPWGGDHLPPRGRLREPIAGLARASAVIITKVDPAADQPPQDIVRRIINIRPDLPVFAARLVPQRVRTEAGWLDPTELRGRKVFAVAGLGRPEGFRTLLESAGAEVIGHRWFADHHPYGPEDRAWIAREAQKYGALVVTTAKDAVKLDPFEGLWVVETAMQSLEGGWGGLWSLAPEIG
jgi:tetraacyldisaccharide 4'-kinase